jgi:hypothetical protein
MDNTATELLNWLTSWFGQFCDGYWERENQIKIQTVNNPGWWIQIDLTDTPLENISVNEKSYVSEDDWYFCTIKDGAFRGSGDLMKLAFLLSVFRRIAENNVTAGPKY